MVKTPNQIIKERSELADKIVKHLNDWNELKQKQSRRNDDFTSGGLFNLIDLLDRDTVRQAISLYIQINP